MTTRVAILGFGRIGHVHADALRLVDDVELVGAGDVLTEVVAAGPDAVIVATPTWTHAAVVRDLRSVWDGRIVVEKPVATALVDVEAMFDDPRIHAVYHAAFAPEVEWAVSRLDAWRAAHGDVDAFDMAFADAYAADIDRATATLGDSWTDGGINALSVLARFVEPQRCTVRREVPGSCSTFETTVACGGATAGILTTWAAVEPSKVTRLSFADGAVAVLDHQAVLGRLEVDGAISEAFAPSPTPPRLVQHYVGCFTRLFAGAGGMRSFPVETDRLLHRLLLEPAAG